MGYKLEACALDSVDVINRKLYFAHSMQKHLGDMDLEWNMPSIN